MGYLLCHLFFFELADVVGEENLCSDCPPPSALVFGLYSLSRAPVAGENTRPSPRL